VLVVESGVLRRLDVLVLRQTDLQGQHVAHLESRVHAQQPGETAPQERGAGHQHQRQRDLGHGQDLALPSR
jgi:hypothetical protein